MSHYSRAFSNVGDRREWLLALLYTPVDGAYAQSIQGRTRLMKGAFLLSMKLEEELGIETDFDFRRDKHGPLDPLVFTATEQLQENSKLEIVPVPNNHGGDYYQLTEEGEEEAKAVWERLDEKEQEILQYVKNRHLQQPLAQILNYVYRQYPEYSKEV